MEVLGAKTSRTRPSKTKIRRGPGGEATNNWVSISILGVRISIQYFCLNFSDESVFLEALWYHHQVSYEAIDTDSISCSISQENPMEW